MKGVIRPSFDEIQFNFQNMKTNQSQNLKTLANYAFEQLEQICTVYFRNLPLCFASVVEILGNCSTGSTQFLVNLSLNSLNRVIANEGGFFGDHHWSVVVNNIQRILQKTYPR